MALKITFTDVGLAEIVNANNTGTGPVEITHIAFTETAFEPKKELKALPDEIKRVSSIAGEIVAADTISVTAKDEGQDSYTMRGFGIFTQKGTLLAVYGQAEPIIEKASGSTMLLTIDAVLADIDAASLTFGDISFSNPPASLTTPGVVTLSNATDSTAQNQAATPRAVKAANDNANTRLAKSQNLADLVSAAAARVNLGLGASATMGTTALRTSSSTTVLLQAAAMNDHRTSGDHDDRYPQRGNNLSDLPSPSQARSNLGLSTAATMGTTASRTSTSTTTVLQAKAMNDHRQSDDHDGRYVRLTGADLGSNDLKARLTHNNGYFYIGSYSSSYGEGALQVWWNATAKQLNMGGAQLRNVTIRQNEVTDRKPVTDLDLVGIGSSDTAATVFALREGGRSPTIRDDVHAAHASGIYYGLSPDNAPGGWNGHYYWSNYNASYQKFLFIPQNTTNRLFIGGNHSDVWYPPAEVWTDENLKLTVDGVNVGLAGLMTTKGLNLPNGVTLRGITSGLEITRVSGSVEIGNRNSSYTHYTSSAGKHYFYGEVHSQSGFYGDGSGLTGTARLRATGTTKADVGLSKVPNLDATTDADPNTAMIRDVMGDTWARLFRSTYKPTNSTIAAIYTTREIGGDYMRPSTPEQVRDAMGAYHQGNIANAFPRSLAGNGRIQLPGGMILQWGTLNFGITTAGGELRRNVSFPLTFPNGAWHVVASLKSGLYVDGSSCVSAENLVPTGFTAVYTYPWNGGRIDPSISWIALGN